MIEIIPAIDLIEGKCVRLRQGDYAQKTVYDASPHDMVSRYVDHGFNRVHIVDLDGAKASHPVNFRVLEQVAAINGAEIEWGGGIKERQHLTDLFNAGTTYAVVGSVAARNPELFTEWLREFGGERMVLGADLRDGKVAVSGWLADTELTADDLLEQFVPNGLSQAIVTDISRDGMLQGPAYELYVGLQSRWPKVKFTVSGGISNIDDIVRLDEAGLPRVIVGKAIYEGRISLSDLSKLIS